MTANEARDIMVKHNKTIQTNDPRFNRIVLLVHQEGETCFFTRAFLMNVDDEWIAVFTEHCGINLLNRGDLKFINQYKPIDAVEKIGQ
jgi:hypothetical protein